MTGLQNYDFTMLFNAGEQPGSQRAYEIDRELQRRREIAQQEVDKKMIAAADAQIAAADASVRSARAAEDTAKWTRLSACLVALTVILMAIGTFVDALKP
ncbi:hypothetical protein NGM99_21265 [Mesorhizobium sp. RP14(2022)]|uniref:Uncharacterized protein n=1 Tax=Mesorhizobium liriopis TaxID=2953882 RepID=A0ABT1CBW6_9HYPH|nr:hypothetical protein [Mesorhizobium liriopis]MCO6052323.1 hypothetical protein [Mesorhizobium liriopis]